MVAQESLGEMGDYLVGTSAWILVLLVAQAQTYNTRTYPRFGKVPRLFAWSFVGKPDVISVAARSTELARLFKRKTLRALRLHAPVDCMRKGII